MELRKKSYARVTETVPVKYESFQANCCKNPRCTQFSQDPHDFDHSKYELRKGSNPFYTISGAGKNAPHLQCRVCREITPIKSNEGIIEEEKRLSSYLKASTFSCPDVNCNNHLLSVEQNPKLYKKHGQTSGNRRYQCKSCNRTFSTGNKKRIHRRSEINKSFFIQLVNKTPMRRACEILDISSKTYFDKLDWLYSQTCGFLRHRETKLLNGIHLNRVEICTDRQVHISNWSDRTDKRNVEIWATGSADNITGYVFGVHFNYDPLIDRMKAEMDASLVDPSSVPPHLQPHARLWLKRAYEMESPLISYVPVQGVNALENTTYEQSEIIDGTTQLPNKGALVHSEYTMYAHFLLLSKLLMNVTQVHYSLDREAGIRNAFMIANKIRINAGEVHGFYVNNKTGMTVDDKKDLVKVFYKNFSNIAGKSFGNATNSERHNTIINMIAARLSQLKRIPNSKEFWLHHPHLTMPEPEKLVAALTPISHLSVITQAELYKPASLAAIDRFFMFVRRRVSILERSKSVASNERRKWHGYSAYNPYSYIKVMEIVRLYFNYCLQAKDGTTAAMRIGLAKNPIKPERVVYFE